MAWSAAACRRSGPGSCSRSRRRRTSRRRRPAGAPRGRPLSTASRASRVAFLVMSSARSGTALIRSGKLRLMRAATTTGRSSGAGKGRSGASASSRRRARSPSRPAPVGGGCASIQATIRSGKSRRSSAGSKRSSRLDHGIRCGRLCVTFVVIIWSSMPLAWRSPKVSGSPSSLPARSSIRSASHGRQGRRPAALGREAGAEAEAVLAQSLRQPESHAQAERHREAEKREDDAGDHRADGERAGARPDRKDGERDPRRRARRRPSGESSGARRPRRAAIFRCPSVRAPLRGGGSTGVCAGWGWKRRNRLSPPPIHAGSSASFSNPPCSRPCSAAAAPAAAIAPADVPPMFANL